MKKNLLLLIFIVCTIYANAQTTFQRVYPDINMFRSVQQTTDGGYIAAGNQSLKACLLKLDTFGSIVWSKSFSGANYLQFNSVRQTSDGGYIAAGTSRNQTTQVGRFYLVRTNASGDTLWTRFFGNSQYTYCNSVRQTTDGGFILGGETSLAGSYTSMACVIKTDINGNMVWSKTFASPTTNNSQSCNEIQTTSDGGYVLTGVGYHAGAQGILVIKLDSAGDTLWTRGYGAPGFSSNYLDGKSIVQTSEGGYIVLGINDIGPSNAIYLIKLNAAGDTTFVKFIVTSGNGTSNGNHTIKQTADGGYAIACNSGMSGGSNDAGILIKMDTLGNVQWSKCYWKDNSGFSMDCGIYDMEITNNGDFVLAGYYYKSSISGSVSGAYILKTDSLGTADCHQDSLDIINYGNYTIGIHKGSVIGSIGSASNMTSTIGTINTIPTNPCLDFPSICLVTVDSLLQKNRIVWEKDFDTTSVASYNIYKETTTSNVYALIGNVPNNNLSTFVDMSSIPEQRADRYKITSVDPNGNEASIRSTAHKTIHLNMNLGNPPQKNLIWDGYQGFTVNTYRIWRGNAGGMTLIDSVQGTITSYTDLNPPTTDSIYFIEALHTPCNPVAKSIHYSSTRSNIHVISTTLGISEADMGKLISLSPNPAAHTLNINGLASKAIATVYDISGKLILTQQLPSCQIDISSLAKGLYFIKLTTAEGNVVKKFVKE